MKALLDAFDWQVAWCREPSPFTSRLLDRSRRWLASDTQARAAFEAADPTPLAAAISLRWAGGLHLLALRGLEPWASLWPPAGPADDDALDDAIRQAWATQRPALLDALARAPQTNEVQRSAVLLPGLLEISAATGLPLALREIGSSAGLNLWCERHRYDYGAWGWGDAGAALVLEAAWRGAVPAAAGRTLTVLDRAGCDAHPVDLLDAGQRLRLRSYIWPDQAARLQRFDIAAGAAAGWMSDGAAAVRRQRAADFVERELAAPRDGVATVLMHSVVWQYIEAGERDRITAAVAAAAARATPAAPLAWLTMEPPATDGQMALRLRLWPHAIDRVLAVAHPHGAWIAAEP